MGLLSIILHAAPANTAGLVKRAAAQPMPDYARGDLDRLWRLASPWLSGTANPRSACTWIALTLHHSIASPAAWAAGADTRLQSMSS